MYISGDTFGIALVSRRTYPCRSSPLYLNGFLHWNHSWNDILSWKEHNAALEYENSVFFPGTTAASQLLVLELVGWGKSLFFPFLLLWESTICGGFIVVFVFKSNSSSLRKEARQVYASLHSN